MRSSRVPGLRTTHSRRQALETRRLIAEAARQPDPERGAGLISTYLCGRPLLEERLCGRRTPLTGWSREWKIVTL
jgi:hypothetical protein